MPFCICLALHPDQFAINAMYTVHNTMGNVCGFHKDFWLSRQSLYHGAYTPGAIFLNEGIGNAYGGVMGIPKSAAQLSCCEKIFQYLTLFVFYLNLFLLETQLPAKSHGSMQI